MRVSAKYSKDGFWYPGKIQRINKNQTYDIQFDDGDYDMDTPLKHLKRQEKSK